MLKQISITSIMDAAIRGIKKHKTITNYGVVDFGFGKRQSISQVLEKQMLVQTLDLL